jgi:hypothetical protein
MLAALAALAAAVMFLLGVLVPDITRHNPEFWLLLGLMCAALAAAAHLARVAGKRVP